MSDSEPRDALIVDINQLAHRAEVFLDECIRVWRELLAHEEALLHLEATGSPDHVATLRRIRAAAANLSGLHAMREGTFSMLLSVPVPPAPRPPPPRVGPTPPPDPILGG